MAAREVEVFMNACTMVMVMSRKRAERMAVVLDACDDWLGSMKN